MRVVEREYPPAVPRDLVRQPDSESDDGQRHAESRDSDDSRSVTVFQPATSSGLSDINQWIEDRQPSRETRPKTTQRRKVAAWKIRSPQMKHARRLVAMKIERL
jgi:hypothetical protein